MTISIIVTLSKHAQIGYDVSAFDICYFERISRLTQNDVIIMGRHTWDSLSESATTALGKNNIIVVTTRPMFVTGSKVQFVSPKEIDHFIGPYKDVFVLGGESLYAAFINRADTLYVTLSDAPPPSESAAITFPSLDQFQRFTVAHVNPNDNRNIVYERITQPGYVHGERAYLNVMNEILQSRVTSTGMREDRTKVGTVSVFGRQMRFDISKSVPLLTTKFVGWKSIIHELLWFIQGKTDSKILEQQKISIWKGNTTREFLDNRGLQNYDVGDIGPMYGFQWRHMGAEYKGAAHDYKSPSYQGFDQINWLINSIKTDPYSRRHMITTFNPIDVDKGVLAPCHGIVVQFYVEPDTLDPTTNPKHLSCHVYNRSQDTFLGMPYNIFSYAALTYIIAKFTHTVPKDLVISTGDTHIYSNHIEQCIEQFKRTPMPFPILKIKDDVSTRPGGIDALTIEDFQIAGYVSHPPIKAPMAV